LPNAHTISQVVIGVEWGKAFLLCVLSFFAGVIVIGKLLVLEQHRCNQFEQELAIERKRREEWQKRFWEMQGIAQRAAEACESCVHRNPKEPD
jgi:hypothetical protein